MSYIKKFAKKFRKRDKHPKTFGVPSHIDLVSPDAGAESDTEVRPEGALWNLEADGADLTAVTGADHGQGSRIVFPASSHQRSHESGASTTRMREEDVPLALERGSEQEVSQNAQNEQTGLYYPIQEESEDMNRRERDWQEMVAEGPIGIRLGHASDDDHIGEDARVIWPGKSTGVIESTAEDKAIRGIIIPEEAANFDPLKEILLTIFHSHKGIVAKNMAEDLHSRIGKLEPDFKSPPRNTEVRNRQDDIIKGFNDIDVRLRLSGGSEAQRPILDELQEIIFAYEQESNPIDPAESDFLDSLGSAKKAEYRHGDRKGCLKGTRRTILEEIESWTWDFDKSPVYWLNGLAGTGKSTIAQSVSERTFANGRLGASFFCSRNFEDRRDLRLIFPTLAVQLARRYPEFRSIFIPLVRSDKGVIDQSLENQLKQLIVQPLTKSAISTVIVIDALDECTDNETISAILSVLGRQVAGVQKVKFFLTGRPEPRIQTGFRLPLLKDVTDVFVLHEVKPKLVANDIQSFFKHSFLEIAKSRRGLDGWPADEEVEHLCERAAGLFVYAVATVKFIQKRATSPRKQLNLLLQSPESSTREAKTEFETNVTLDLLYTSILHEAFGDPDDDPKVRSVFGAMLLAANPISPSTIASLLELDVDEVFALLSSAQSLLILQEEVNCPVQPFHKSFPDFIIDPNRCTKQRFHLSLPHHHSQLMFGCLDLMDRKLEKNMCQLPDSVANSDIKDLKDRVEQYIDPALRYACRSWHTHLIGGHATSINRPEITTALHRFLKGNFLFWLEVLSVLGAVRIAVDALQAAADWLEESPTLELAEDCSRFVIWHFNIISASSPHIYHSALVLTPAESIVRKLYESHAQPFVRVVCGVPALWDSIAATTTTPFAIARPVWSPCSRFIAICSQYTMQVDIVEPTTLQRLQSLEFSHEPSLCHLVCAFSLDSRTLTSLGCHNDSYTPLFVVSWDLQTGGVVSVIEWEGHQDVGDIDEGLRGNGATIEGITHSMNGRMVALLSRYHYFSIISIYDIVSGVFVCNIDSRVCPELHLGLEALPVEQIWAHGESLQFRTSWFIDTIIWEVEFALGATPIKVETVTIPNTTFGASPLDSIQSVFHPASCRLALACTETSELLIWDAQVSKSLLRCTDVSRYPHIAFSSDGSFLALQNNESQFCLWKESSSGYTLFKKLQQSAKFIWPHLSPSFESFVTTSVSKVQLQHIRGITATPSSIFPQVSISKFVLEFHPDRALAVFTRELEKIVAVLDLKSNVLQLTIDTSIQVFGLRLIENTVVVMGNYQSITWELPRGNLLPGAAVNIGDSTQTINYQPGYLSAVSISLDLKYIAFQTYDGGRNDLVLYCTSTKQSICVIMPQRSLQLWFVPGEHNIWCVDDNKAEVFTIGHDTLDHTMTILDMEDGSWGSPWGSSCGYKVTQDGWILGVGGKRLLMLPPLWQSQFKVDRVWNGKFLALLNVELPEVVILELEP